MAAHYRLTYHEAFVAQGAREILASGNWWHPSIGGLPWLEKPPLPFWLVAGLGWCMGEISPLTARLPSAIAAAFLVLGVSQIATRRYGATVGILAGAIQVTTAWTVLRGRLAEADILLACLITWTLLAFDRIRSRGDESTGSPLWRWLFFGLLGLTSLVKGTGFGAVLTAAVVAMVLLWDRDRKTWQQLQFPAGWLLVLVLTLAWPLAMIARYGWPVAGLWMLHVSERIGPRVGHGVFAGESWATYGLNIVGQALPWAPLIIIGASNSLIRGLSRYRQGGSTITAERFLTMIAGDRLLWVWAVAPLLLVSLASARSAHYTIYALIPWSIWSALGLLSLSKWWINRGWSATRLRYLAVGTFSGLATIYGLGFWLGGPWFDRRGTEWAFYESASRQVAPDAHLALLYDDWDRDPYPTPFGPIPHDLGVRLYYLNRPACWHFGVESLVDHQTRACSQHAVATSLRTIGGDRPRTRPLGSPESGRRGSAHERSKHPMGSNLSGSQGLAGSECRGPDGTWGQARSGTQPLKLLGSRRGSTSDLRSGWWPGADPLHRA